MLAKRGQSERVIEKVLGGNFLRLFTRPGPPLERRHARPAGGVIAPPTRGSDRAHRRALPALARTARYARGKLRWDPLFAAAVPLFADSARPLLDIGCGLGLLGQYLRERGIPRAVSSASISDGARSSEAHAARDGRCARPRFRGRIGATSLPPFQRRRRADRRAALPAGRIAAAGARRMRRLACRRAACSLIRNVLRDASLAISRHGRRRSASRARSAGCASRPVIFRDAKTSNRRSPTLGFDAHVEPLWGRTPFNSYLIVARRESRLSGVFDASAIFRRSRVRRRAHARLQLAAPLGKTARVHAPRFARRPASPRAWCGMRRNRRTR